MKQAKHSENATRLIAEVARLIREDFRRRAQHLSLTQPQSRLLLIISREPGINQASLAGLLEVHPVTVTQSVDRLEKAGWLRRERQETDRRSVSLFVTDQAKPILAELDGIADQTRAATMAGLSVDEQAALEAMLLRIKANFCGTDAEGLQDD
ncbi:MarR family transcriptional regulator [Spongiibacter taiwanensis]|uniref:MarR family winged helix-turn-helix transcriptional regulator n=1 Tax=Spongiibacter taiwanensis TaxID=1748242 RepID=UPI0020354903|nr:MarR family transcriptional regulator [Spongiibacter taiwanensis]USA42226.1 MarR family transcriptional regulator [Spongiibacter taiwanensis]